MADEPGGAVAWNKFRIEALSDGVFAIVMTLLVLEIKVPELPRDAAAAAVWHGLREHWSIFLSFFITFMYAGVYWFLHHVVFHQIRSADTKILFINLGFLMFVSLLPFSTAMVGAFTLRQPVSIAIYFGNLFTMALVLEILWTYACRRGFVPDHQTARQARRISLMLLVQPLAGGAALAIVPIAPQHAFRVFGLMNVVGIVVIRKRLGGDFDW